MDIAVFRCFTWTWNPSPLHHLTRLPQGSYQRWTFASYLCRCFSAEQWKCLAHVCMSSRSSCVGTSPKRQQVSCQLHCPLTPVPYSTFACCTVCVHNFLSLGGAGELMSIRTVETQAFLKQLALMVAPAQAAIETSSTTPVLFCEVGHRLPLCRQKLLFKDSTPTTICH